MKIRPWPIVIIALVCILAPLFNLGYSAGLQGKGVFEYLRTIQEFRGTADIAIWILLPISVGVSILAFKKWSYFLFLGFMILIMYLAYDQWLMFPESFTIRTLLLAELLNIIAIAYFLHPSVRYVYFEPRVRWWQQKPRFVCDLKAEIVSEDKSFPCFIKNISEGGILVGHDADTKANQDLKVRFQVVDVPVVAVGRVVHKGYEGDGIMFMGFESDSGKFKKIVARLRDHGFKLRTEIPPWRESLKEWAFTLAKTGKGIFPKTDHLKRN